ncbi:MAG: hypothetical protein GF365_01095|nr:hypothetical protein [Candidatus Buchananbacteria bacterium]
MKKIFKIYLIIFIFGFILSPLNQAAAVTSLNNVSLDVQPRNIKSPATWSIAFNIPQDSQVGHILVSLAGMQPDLSQAQLNVSGLPKGTAKVGKTNPNCVSNCDDIRYYFDSPVNVKAGSYIVFTLTNVINPDQQGQTGINFINVFSSKYPQRELAFNANDYFIQLEEESDEVLIPESVINEGQVKAEEISQVMINELFYQEGAKTTKLSEIEDAGNVQDFTLDLLGKVKVVFKEPIDLSNEEAVHFIANIADYMTFNYLYFWVAPELMSYFQVPVELTFYNLPYVWEPDILKDNAYVLEEDEIENFNSVIVDDQAQVSFIVREAGGYGVVPRLEVYIKDNQEIKSADNQATFTGRISDPAAIINISLNNKELKDLQPQIDPNTGEFSFIVELIEGANLIEVEAETNYGEIDPVRKIVQYQQTVPEITVNENDIFNPIYYIVIILVFLGLVLVIAIIYLVKTKKK